MIEFLAGLFVGTCGGIIVGTVIIMLEDEEYKDE